MEHEIAIIARCHSAPTMLSAHWAHDEEGITDVIRNEKKTEAIKNDGAEKNTEGADAINHSENVKGTTDTKKLEKEGEVSKEVRAHTDCIMHHPPIHFPHFTSYLPTS